MPRLENKKPKKLGLRSIKSNMKVTRAGKAMKKNSRKPLPVLTPNDSSIVYSSVNTLQLLKDKDVKKNNLAAKVSLVKNEIIAIDSIISSIATKL